MRRVLTMGVLLALAWSAAADDTKKKESDATDLLAAGLAKAKKQERSVFLLFGSPG
jgi:hypothetical protein